MVHWSMIVFQGCKGQAKGALAGRREPNKKHKRKLVDLKRKLVDFEKTMIT